MPDASPNGVKGKLTTLEPGFVSRVAAGIRYAVTGVSPATFFGPDQPLTPQAQQAIGRQFDYPVGFNLRTSVREEAALSFRDLRGLADSYDLLRLVIETRKDQISRLKWNIKVRDTGAKPKPDAKPDPRLAMLEGFFARPDGANDWATWLRMLVEDLLVIDAPCLYRRKSNGGAPYAFEIMDGALIKRVIDDTGRTPLPPSPAYQQILKGLPAVDYTTDQLIYLPRNPRSNRIYGYSPVEQIVMTVNIALRRQVSTLSYYTEGNTPEALVGVPAEWTPDQIGQFQQYWDSLLSGDLGARRHTRFVPGGLDYHPTREPTLKDDFDDWLARVVCFAFSVPPSSLVKQMNRATAQTQKESSDEEGLAPLQLWVKSLVDRILAEDFNSPDLEFAWFDDTQADPLVQMQVNTGYVAAGIKTRNEIRAELGLDAIPDGDEVTITAGNTVTRLADALDPPEPPPQLMMPGQDPMHGDGGPGNNSSFRGPGGPKTPEQTTKADNPDQARVPKGESGGGEWTSGTSALNDLEREAVRRYTGHGARYINDFLRGHSLAETNVKHWIEQLDKVMSRASLPRKQVLYRKVTGDYAWQLNRSALCVGDVLEDKGFVSAARKYSVAIAHNSGEDDRLIMRIEAPRGSRALDISAESLYPNEHETLIGRGARFQVVSYNTARRTMNLRLLPHGTDETS